MLLFSKALRDIALLVRRRLELGQHHIEPFHQADLLGLQLLQLVGKTLVSVIDLATEAELVLVGLLTRGQRCV